MSSGNFANGWRVVRTHRSEFIDKTRVRRRTVTAALTATGVGTFLVIATLLWDPFDGSLLQNVAAVVFFSASLGCFSAAFQSVACLAPASSRPLLGDWRRDERINRQLAARPPAMLPEDRDEVLDRAQRSLGPLVAAAERFKWIPVGWVFAWLGVLIPGIANTDRVTLLVLPPVFAVLQSATFIEAVTGAGRADTTRQRALALPPAPPVESPPTRKLDTRGSKLELPDT